MYVFSYFFVGHQKLFFFFLLPCGIVFLCTINMFLVVLEQCHLLILSFLSNGDINRISLLCSLVLLLWFLPLYLYSTFNFWLWFVSVIDCFPSTRISHLFYQKKICFIISTPQRRDWRMHVSTTHLITLSMHIH